MSQLSIAMAKSASYLTEEDRLERKIDRHEQRGYGAEKKRLMAKGQASGRSGGTAVGLLGGAALGGSLGGPVGAIVGGAGGALGGRYLGGRMGRAEGKHEAKAREELAQKLKGKTPEERRKHIDHIIASGRASESTDAQKRMADAAEQANRISMYKSAAYALALAKESAYGQQDAAGTVKTIGGVAKKLVDGKWVDHAPSAGSGILSKLKGLLGGASDAAASSKPIVRSVNVAKARMMRAAAA